jgi:hypothetical protein
MDFDPRTEPFQNSSIFQPAQNVRMRFHAFAPLMGNSRETRERNRKAAYERAWNTGNPGAYLHFYMDIYAHDGFGPAVGHVAAGHLPDFLSSDPDRAARMTRGALSILWEFRTRRSIPFFDLLSEDGKPNARPPWVGAGVERAQLDDAYKRAQPVLDQLVAASAAGFFSRPDASRAGLIVAAALGERVPTLDQRIDFRFNNVGLPVDPTQYDVLAPRAGQLAITGGRNRTRLVVPVSRLFARDQNLRSRVLLDNRVPARISVESTEGASSAVLALDPVRPGTHTLSIDNPGPGGRIYRHQVTFVVDAANRVQQQGPGVVFVIRPRS